MDKIALITCSSREIGKNSTLDLAAKGNHIIITHDTKAEETVLPTLLP